MKNNISLKTEIMASVGEFHEDLNGHLFQLRAKAFYTSIYRLSLSISIIMTIATKAH